MSITRTMGSVLAGAAAISGTFLLALSLSGCDASKSTIEAPGSGASGSQATPPSAASHEGLFEVNDANFEAEVLKAKSPVLVDFWAPWCGPCRALGPTIQELAKDYSGKVKVCKVNVDQSPKTSETYQITGIPHVALFVNGKIVKSFVGLNSKPTYTQALDSQLKGG